MQKCHPHSKQIVHSLSIQLFTSLPIQSRLFVFIYHNIFIPHARFQLKIQGLSMNKDNCTPNFSFERRKELAATGCEWTEHVSMLTVKSVGEFLKADFPASYCHVARGKKRTGRQPLRWHCAVARIEKP